MPVVPMSRGRGFGLFSFLSASEREERDAKWDEFLSSLSRAPRLDKRWRRFAPKRRIKKEMKRVVSESGVNFIEIETDNPSLKNHEIRRIKNMLGRALSKKVTIS